MLSFNQTLQTLSFSSALEILGFGPCHHAYMVTPEAMKWDKLARAAKGEVVPFQPVVKPLIIHLKRKTLR